MEYVVVLFTGPCDEAARNTECEVLHRLLLIFFLSTSSDHAPFNYRTRVVTATVTAASGTRGATRTAEGRAATATATGTAIAAAATGIAIEAADEDGRTDGCSDVDFNASGFISSGWIRIMSLNECAREIHTMS